MSQAALASRVTEMGVKWSQPTVAAIEKGERSLKWSEGVLLAGLIQFGAVWVTDPTITADAAKWRRVLSAAIEAES
jgi:hypothetical protein